MAAAMLHLCTPWHSEPTSSAAAAEARHLLVGAATTPQVACRSSLRPAYAVRSVQGRRSYQEDAFDVRFDLLGCLSSPQPGGLQLQEASHHLPSSHASCSNTPQQGALDGSSNSSNTISQGPPLLSFAAVFDGHGGSAVAQHCTERLAPILRSHLLRRYGSSSSSSSDSDSFPPSPNTTDGGAPPSAFPSLPGSNANLLNPADQQQQQQQQQYKPVQGDAASLLQGEQDVVTEALVRSFLDCDACVPAAAASEGGSTAVCAVLGPDCIWVANCGDSRAMVARRGALAVAMSEDHKPERPDETARVRAAGGHVFWNGGHRVMGVLSMTRAMGDQYLKQYGVICTPEVMRVERTPEDEFLLLASDGLWAALSNAEAVGVAAACIERAQARGADRPAALRVAAQVLVKAALQQGSSDNITVVLVDLLRPTSTSADATQTNNACSCQAYTASAGGGAGAALPMPALVHPPPSPAAHTAAATALQQQQQALQHQHTEAPPTSPSATPYERGGEEEQDRTRQKEEEETAMEASPAPPSPQPHSAHPVPAPAAPAAPGGAVAEGAAAPALASQPHGEAIHGKQEQLQEEDQQQEADNASRRDASMSPEPPVPTQDPPQPNNGNNGSYTTWRQELTSTTSGLLVTTPPPPHQQQQQQVEPGPFTSAVASLATAAGVTARAPAAGTTTRLDLRHLSLCTTRSHDSALAGGGGGGADDAGNSLPSPTQQQLYASLAAAHPDAAATAAAACAHFYYYPNLHPWLSYTQLHAAASAAAAAGLAGTTTWGSTLVSTGAATATVPPRVEGGQQQQQQWQVVHPHTAPNPTLPPLEVPTGTAAGPDANATVSAAVAAARARRRSDGGLQHFAAASNNASAVGGNHQELQQHNDVAPGVVSRVAHHGRTPSCGGSSLQHQGLGKRGSSEHPAAALLQDAAAAEAFHHHLPAGVHECVLQQHYQQVFLLAQQHQFQHQFQQQQPASQHPLAAHLLHLHHRVSAAGPGGTQLLQLHQAGHPLAALRQGATQLLRLGSAEGSAAAMGDATAAPDCGESPCKRTRLSEPPMSPRPVTTGTPWSAHATASNDAGLCALPAPAPTAADAAAAATAASSQPGCAGGASGAPPARADAAGAEATDAFSGGGDGGVAEAAPVVAVASLA